MAGPAMGGLLVDGLGWRSVFVVNVPLGVAVLIVGARALPAQVTGVRRTPDLVGTGLIVGGALLLVPALARA